MGTLAVYGIGLVLSGRRAALLAALALLGTFEYRHMARIARPDMIFVAAILGSCLAVALAMRRNEHRLPRLALGGSLAGIAAVTKGPLGAVVPALFGLLLPIRRADLRALRAREWATFVAGLAALIGLWATCLWLTGHDGYLLRLFTQPDLAGSDPDPLPGYRYASWETGYGDFRMVPDISTLRLVPWLEKTAMVICDVADEETGEPVEVAPRQILKRQIERATAAGYTSKMGSELEFYLSRRSWSPGRSSSARSITPSHRPGRSLPRSRSSPWDTASSRWSAAIAPSSAWTSSPRRSPSRAAAAASPRRPTWATSSARR